MSTTDPGPSYKKVFLKLGMVPLGDELANLLDRELVSIDLSYDSLYEVQCVEPRRPRDEAIMARLVRVDGARWKFVDLHPDFVAALEREGLTPREEGCLAVPVAHGGGFARGVARALESCLTRADDQTAEEQSSRDPVSDLWDLLRRGTGSISGPADWSLEHDHYLYGTPKRAGGEDEK